MTQRLIRIYQNLDIEKIKSHLLLYGDLAGQCAQCQQIGIKLDVLKCPHCQADFQFLAFKNIKDHLPKISKILRERPSLVLVDFDDFKRISSANKAEEFLK